MFFVLLKYTKKKNKADPFAEGHMKWVKKGLDDGVFLLVGSIKPGIGGAILAHGITLSALKKRVGADPFVAEKIVTAEILEIDPVMAEKRLKFLVEE